MTASLLAAFWTVLWMYVGFRLGVWAGREDAMSRRGDRD